MLLVLSGLSPAIPDAPRLAVGTARLVTGALSYSEGVRGYPITVIMTLDHTRCIHIIIYRTPMHALLK
jgi:hypothetical protein